MKRHSSSATPLRILHLYAGNLYGGIETLLATLARCQSLCPQMQSSFGLCFRGRIWSELESASASVHDLQPVRCSRPWTVVRARRNLLCLLKTAAYDVVATHSNWPHAVFAPAVRAARVPLVNFVHDALRSRTWIDWLAAQSPPDLAIGNSRYTAQYISRLFGNAPIEVVYLPVQQEMKRTNPRARQRVRGDLNTTDESTVIIQVSRMEEWKGAHITLEALGQMKNLESDWTAWLVGGSQRPEEQAYENQLHTLADSLGIADRVRFTGQRNDVPELLNAGDIFCQPNVGGEPFGIVFIEALRAGLPVVTSNIGGGVEIVTAECGRLTAPGDAAELAACLTSYCDPNARPDADTCRARAAQLCDPTQQLSAYHASISRTIPQLIASR